MTLRAMAAYTTLTPNQLKTHLKNRERRLSNNIDDTGSTRPSITMMRLAHYTRKSQLLRNGLSKKLRKCIKKINCMEAHIKKVVEASSDKAVILHGDVTLNLSVVID